MNENIPELKMLDKELNVSYVDDFTKLEKHISNLRIIAIGLSNELQGKSKQLQAYKDKIDKLREMCESLIWCTGCLAPSRILKILNEGDK